MQSYDEIWPSYRESDIRASLILTTAPDDVWLAGQDETDGVYTKPLLQIHESASPEGPEMSGVQHMVNSISAGAPCVAFFIGGRVLRAPSGNWALSGAVSIADVDKRISVP